jgi:CRP/FNR family transcriptional regulator
MDTPFPVSDTAARGAVIRATTTPPFDIELLHRHAALAQRKLRAGEYLYRNGQPFNSLYLVHAGFLKTCELAQDGREQVTGFPMRGELLGVESIGLDAYACDVVALDDCVVWCVPYHPVLGASTDDPALHARLAAALANAIRRDRSWMLTVGTLAAENRVAAFLLDFAARQARLGFSSNHFILRMGRADIASYLALTHETVTRALTRLAQRGLISVLRREIRLLDIPKLRASTGTSATVH